MKKNVCSWFWTQSDKATSCNTDSVLLLVAIMLYHLVPMFYTEVTVNERLNTPKMVLLRNIMWLKDSKVQYSSRKIVWVDVVVVSGGEITLSVVVRFGILHLVPPTEMLKS